MTRRNTGGACKKFRSAFLLIFVSGAAGWIFPFNGASVSGTMVSGVGNNLLKWETVEDWNVGVDMSFL
ncbi:hypothetical protein, partial [Akkermansia sp.]|uniref:hypothetical protein n=1 Tax=Akkermansia sp. TaxID=1872421 RepID=UPI003AB3BEFD